MSQNTDNDEDSKRRNNIVMRTRRRRDIGIEKNIESKKIELDKEKENESGKNKGRMMKV